MPNGQPNTSRLLVEIIVAIACAEAGVMFMLPSIAPGVNDVIEACLDAGLLALIAGPIIFWRMRAAMRRAQGPSPVDRPDASRKATATVAAVVLLGLGATYLAVMWAVDSVRRESLARFEGLTERLVGETQRRVSQPRFGLAGARGVYAASRSVERNEFDAYVASRDLPQEFPGAIGFGMVERVERRDLEAFIAAERLDDAPDFQVHVETAEDGTVQPASSEPLPDLFVVKHCYPKQRNIMDWGVDIGAEPIRREAAERAMWTGQPAITARIQLRRDSQRKTGFLYFLPVYDNGSNPTTPEEREAALTGLLYAPIVLEDALEGIADSVQQTLDFDIFDGVVPSKANQLYDHDHNLDGAKGAISASAFSGRMFETSRQIQIAGRTWTVLTSTTPKFEAGIDRSTPFGIGLGGTALGLLVAAYIHSLQTGHSRAVSLARGMTIDLATAKSDAEDALREVVAFRNTLDMHSMISVTDHKGRIIDANSIFCDVSGYSFKELLGQDHRILKSGVHDSSFWADAWRTLSAGRPWRGEVCNRRKDGSLYWVDSIIAPFIGSDGKVERYVSITTDITARKQAESDLMRSREEAESANRAKSAFLANMSHEIRTPLTSILGFADLLREDGNESISVEQRGQLIETVRKAGAHLLVVINDILDLSKIEADKMTVEKTETSLVGVLREVESLMRPRAAGKGLKLDLVLGSAVPARILSDPTRLRQILMNLVGNAIKFSEEGGVTVTVRPMVTEHSARITIDIEDTGRGMTVDESSRLFAAFTQVDETVARKYGGTGLGLTISKRLAKLMGGTVELAYTEPGKGSRFHVDLPLNAVPGSPMVSRLDVVDGEATAAAKVVVTLKGRILLAEDGLDNQRLIAFHLRRAGATVELAGNGLIALNMIESATAAGTPYDLLLSDMSMPEMDGYALARTLRQRGNKVAIVALTAHAMAGDRTRCMEMGCDDYATKPIDAAVLLAACSKWMGKESTATNSIEAA